MTLTALLVAIALAIVGNIATGTVRPPDSWHWWTASVWAVVALLVIASIGIQRAQSKAERRGTDDQAVDDLAYRLERNWSNEAARLGVTRSAPIPLSWPSADGPFPEIVSAFRELPRRQLIVLGAPGAGKSVFAMLLTLGLIRDRRDDRRVPVLLSLSVWDPAEPVEEFLARRLAREHADVLSPYGDPRRVADRLVEHQRILPVLDGLDELPPTAIGRALQALDMYASTDRPLVVTSRSQDYEQAVRETGTALGRAAVVKLEPVRADAAIEYLSQPETARHRWEPVFDHIRAPGPLAETFSTPLMISLARVAYRKPGTDPGELLTLTTRRAVAGRLMDAFVGAAYDVPPGLGDVSARLRLRYRDPNRARRWLSCLALHLYEVGTRELHPWQIGPGLLTARPRRAAVLTYLAVAAVGGVVAGLSAAVLGLHIFWTAFTGVLAFATAGSRWLQPLWPHGRKPQRRVWRRMGYETHRRRDRAVIIGGYGAGSALAAMLITGDWAVWPVMLIAGALYGSVATVLPRLQTARWRRDDLMGVAAAALQHIVTGSVVLSAARALAGSPSPWRFVLVVAVLCGGTAGLVSGGWIWCRYRLIHARLAVRGWLPWRLRSFLADSHDRGVLRSTGSGQQFRHVILQDHLSRSVREHHLHRRAKDGDISASHQLATLLARQGRLDEAITVLRPVMEADPGELMTAAALVDLLTALGRIDEVRARADAGHGYAGLRLADLLAGQGHDEELRARAEAGDWHAGRRWVELLASQERVNELEARADAGHDYAAELLAKILRRQLREDDLRARADAGGWPAAQEFAELLTDQARFDEAVAVLRPHADEGNADAALWMADLLAGSGCAEEATEIFRAFADRAGHFFRRRSADPRKRLAELLASLGREDELRERADAGDGDAA
ncbi:NACHT domain-containing protein, partial [Micromonospora sp. M51]|uniref:NACHT domain-containing protein n=1 Tax=Micromonospora sp. M51 TaxID=2824889 RepID=UPI001B3650B8